MQFHFHANQAWFKRRILHAPNRFAKSKSIKYDIFQFDASQSNIRLIQSNIRLKFGSCFKRRILHVPNRIEIMQILYVCSNGNLKHVARVQQFYSAKQCDV